MISGLDCGLFSRITTTATQKRNSDENELDEMIKPTLKHDNSPCVHYYPYIEIYRNSIYRAKLDVVLNTFNHG